MFVKPSFSTRLESSLHLLSCPYPHTAIVSLETEQSSISFALSSGVFDRVIPLLASFMILILIPIPDFCSNLDTAHNKRRHIQDV